MVKAVPCKVCGEQERLKFKSYGVEVYWIHCDKCGNVSTPKGSRSEAGEAWNKENIKHE